VRSYSARFGDRIGSSFDEQGDARLSVAIAQADPRALSRNVPCFWHVDCKTLAMADENYSLLLLLTICLLMFVCGVVALSQHPQWFAG
jgi:hypothetical protein